VNVRGTAAEVALGEAQAVLAHVRDPGRRGRLADLAAAVQEGEQAALATYRRLPGGRALSESAAEVSDALSSLAGRTLDEVKVQAAGPGSYLVTLAVEGRELSVRLDRAGARVHAVGV
jgi:hypothetical protein